MEGVHSHHDPIARHLGDDACRGNAKTQAVPAHEGSLRQEKWMHGQAIDEDVVRNFRKRRHSATHRFVGRPQNIEPVDFIVFNHCHCPVNFGTCA